MYIEAFIEDVLKGPIRGQISAARTFDALSTQTRRLVFWVRVMSALMILVLVVFVAVLHWGQTDSKSSLLEGQKENRELLLMLINDHSTSCHPAPPSPETK